MEMVGTDRRTGRDSAGWGGNEWDREGKDSMGQEGVGWDSVGVG